MGRHAAEPTGEFRVVRDEGEDGPQRVYFRPPVPRTDEQPVVMATEPIDEWADDDDRLGYGWAWVWTLIEAVFVAAAWAWLGGAPHPLNLWALALLAPVAGIEVGVRTTTGGWPDRRL